MILMSLLGSAHAFCGTFVAAEGNLTNGASEIALARYEGRTTLTMANDFRGDANEFAMLVPVPVVLDEEDVNVVSPEVFERLQQLIRVRRGQPAFAPTAEQVVHVIDPRILAIERRVSEQRVLALHNLSSEPVELTLPDWAGTTELVSDTERPLSREFTMAPWQTAWLA